MFSQRKFESVQYDFEGVKGKDFFQFPSWSPDGNWIAFYRDSRWGEGYGIYLMRPSGAEMHRILQGESYSDLTWSPDGAWIAVAKSVGKDEQDLYCVRPDGSALQKLTHGNGFYYLPTWSPDGQWLTFVRRKSRKTESSSWASQKRSLYIVRSDGTDFRPLVSDPILIGDDVGSGRPVWSPDGQWIYFTACTVKNVAGYCEKAVIFRVRPDGTDKQQLTDNPKSSYNAVVSPEVGLPFQTLVPTFLGLSLIGFSMASRSHIKAYFRRQPRQSRVH